METMGYEDLRGDCEAEIKNVHFILEFVVQSLNR